MARPKIPCRSVRLGLAITGLATAAQAQTPPAPSSYPMPPPTVPPAPPGQVGPYPSPAPQPYAPSPPQPQPYGQPPQYGQPAPPYTPPAPYAQPSPYAPPAPYAPPSPYTQPSPYAPPSPYVPPAYGQPSLPPPAVSAPVPYWRDPTRRSDGEMVVLYGTSVAYGIGTGIWIDGVAGVSDPGPAFIAPILFGAAVPVGLYFTDRYSPFHRGVPESISTGLWLGAVEGIAIAGTQRETASHAWGFGGQATATWVFATGGGIGGYAFGEWLRPDSRSLTFIASGGAWGAIAGSEFGAALGGSGASCVAPNSCSSWTEGASIVGLIGYDLGLAATGALSIKYMPSWRSQAWMWGGFLLGTAASSVVYFGYIGSADNPRHGLIANSLGGLAGVGLAAALTANMKDDNGTSNAAQHGAWTPPFQIAMQPVTSPLYGSSQTKGAALTVYGDF